MKRYGITKKEFLALKVGDKISQNCYPFDSETLTITEVGYLHYPYLIEFNFKEIACEKYGLIPLFKEDVRIVELA